MQINNHIRRNKYVPSYIKKVKAEWFRKADKYRINEKLC